MTVSPKCVPGATPALTSNFQRKFQPGVVDRRHAILKFPLNCWNSFIPRLFAVYWQGATFCTIEFSKYQGTGNDFIIIDNTTNFFPKTDSKLINFLCDRKIGVGADGLILIEKSKSSDYEMIYFNADGNLGSMCGNGARCSIHFSMLNKIIEHTTSFLACDGLHTGSLVDNFVKVSMSDVLTYDVFNDFIFVDTGSPHLVKCVDDVDQIDIIDISKEMLDQAEQKKNYEKIIVADLNQKLKIADNIYGAILSAGTFTHGHIGPNALDELLRVTKPSGLFVITIHSKVYVNQNFEQKFQDINEQITDLTFHEEKAYGNNPDKDHGNDTVFITVFRKK